MTKQRASTELHKSTILLDDSNSTALLSSGVDQEPRVRLRSRTGLKHLDATKAATFLFSPREAAYDKMKIRIKGLIRLDRPEALHNLVAHVSGRSDDNAVLRVSPGLGKDVYKLAILPDRWLFAGTGNMIPKLGGTRVAIDLLLDLNYTRFVAHQEITNVDTIVQIAPQITLKVRPQTAQQIRCISLDGNDNLLIDVDHIGGTFFAYREERRRKLLAIYLDHIMTLLHAELNALPDSDAELHWNTVVQVEVVWELQHNDALSWLTDFRKAVFAATPASVWRRRTLEMNRQGNADWMVIPLTKKISIRVYAKTRERVRFEIVYLSGVADEVKRRSTKFTATSTLETLLALPAGAVSRLHVFWNAVKPHIISIPVPAADILDFLVRFTTTVPAAYQKTFLSLLANTRGITETSEHGPTPPAICSALVKAKLLMKADRFRHGVPQRYTLNPSFSRAFDAILQRNDSVL